MRIASAQLELKGGSFTFSHLIQKTLLAVLKREQDEPAMSGHAMKFETVWQSAALQDVIFP